MNFELQAELFRRYPKFFRLPGQRLVSCPPSLRCDWITGEGVASFEITPPASPDFIEPLEDELAPFDQRGIECDDGWFPLIDRLAQACEDEIEGLIKHDVPKERWPRIAQIKEKFGGLRFYVDGELSDATRELIRQIETEESFLICEHCGEPGYRRTGGWIRTYCDVCEAEHQARKSLSWEFCMEDFDRQMASLHILLASRQP